MSVPMSKRELSTIQYLYEIYKFNIELGKMCNNGPKKYKTNYSDFIISSGLKALQYAQYANSIYISKDTPQEMFDEREKCLKRAMGLIDNISTTCQIYLELVKGCGVPNDKITKRQEYIGTTTNNIISLINGVMKSDKERYKKYKSQQ